MGLAGINGIQDIQKRFPGVLGRKIVNFSKLELSRYGIKNMNGTRDRIYSNLCFSSISILGERENKQR